MSLEAAFGLVIGGVLAYFLARVQIVSVRSRTEQPDRTEDQKTRRDDQ